MGEFVESPAVLSIGKRPSGATSYCCPEVAFPPPPHTRVNGHGGEALLLSFGQGKASSHNGRELRDPPQEPKSRPKYFRDQKTD